MGKVEIHRINSYGHDPKYIVIIFKNKNYGKFKKRD